MRGSAVFSLVGRSNVTVGAKFGQFCFRAGGDVGLLPRLALGAGLSCRRGVHDNTF